MKKNILSAIAGLALAASFAAPVAAANGPLSGTVNLIKVQDKTVGNTFFQLNATGTIGKCIKSGTSTLALIPDDDKGKQMFSLVQAALLAGKTVNVHLDDAGATQNTYCFAKAVWVN